jgi:NADH-quinone oxidoreductase subunit L
VAMIVGLLVALWAYVWDTSVPRRFVGTFSGLYQFLLNKWYFDELYHLIFVRPAFAVGRFFWKRGDEGTIDRFGPNGAAALVAGTSRVSARLQSGYVYTYAFVMLIGLAGLATWAIAA